MLLSKLGRTIDLTIISNDLHLQQYSTVQVHPECCLYVPLLSVGIAFEGDH